MSIPISALPDISWPALPFPNTAPIWPVLFQLEQSQWWSAERLFEHQRRQLSHVLRHAYDTVPFYRARFDSLGIDSAASVTADCWNRVPLLSRRDVQIAGGQLHSQQIPVSHGRVSPLVTSGSTGEPVSTLTTDVTRLFWRALTLRDHFWHRRDFTRSLAAIRYLSDESAKPPLGHREENWGVATAGLFATGPAYLLNVLSTIEEQVDWLLQVEPDYQLCYPSVLLGISQNLEAKGIDPRNVLQLRTFGEILEPECRATCERAFGAKVVDFYSSQEVGYIALQCPDCQNYHVQSENLLVEVLDEQARPCAPGRIGKVVVTTLHNFAMPLLRYDIGDFAEVGPTCPCGRGLPVLKKILGRQRNLLRMPDGELKWPVFDQGQRSQDLPVFFQFQVIQRTLTQIDVNVVRHSSLEEHEISLVKRYMQEVLGHPFDINVIQVDSISRSPAGKFEDFISLVS